MKEKYRQLAAYFLSLASDEFSNHGCNDIDKEAFEGWSEDDLTQLAKDYHAWRNEIQDSDNPDYNGRYLPDWGLMSFLSAKLKQERTS